MRKFANLGFGVRQPGGEDAGPRREHARAGERVRQAENDGVSVFPGLTAIACPVANWPVVTVTVTDCPGASVPDDGNTVTWPLPPGTVMFHRTVPPWAVSVIAMPPGGMVMRPPAGFAVTVPAGGGGVGGGDAVWLGLGFAAGVVPAGVGVGLAGGVLPWLAGGGAGLPPPPPEPRCDLAASSRPAPDARLRCYRPSSLDASMSARGPAGTSTRITVRVRRAGTWRHARGSRAIPWRPSAVAA